MPPVSAPMRVISRMTDSWKGRVRRESESLFCTRFKVSPTKPMKPDSGHLSRTLTAVEYFTFGFGTMVGVGWVVLIDDWLARGGPGGAMLGFLLGGILLLPVARTYGRLVRQIPDAGGEIAYAEGVFPRSISFAA